MTWNFKAIVTRENGHVEDVDGEVDAEDAMEATKAARKEAAPAVKVVFDKLESKK